MHLLAAMHLLVAWSTKILVRLLEFPAEFFAGHFVKLIIQDSMTGFVWARTSLLWQFSWSNAQYFGQTHLFSFRTRHFEHFDQHFNCLFEIIFSRSRSHDSRLRSKIWFRNIWSFQLVSFKLRFSSCIHHSNVNGLVCGWQWRDPLLARAS